MGKPKANSPGTRRYGTKTRYTEEQLNNILEELRTGKIGQREASNKYGIPRNTLRNKLFGKHQKNVGRPQVFTSEEEEIFVSHIAHVSDLGFPISLFDVRCIAKGYLDSKKKIVHQFKNNMPGWEWGKLFLSRHKYVLKDKFAKNIARKRAQVNEAMVTEYFENLKSEIKNSEGEIVKPCNIYNMDETGFHDNPAKQKLLFRRLCRHPERVQNSTKSCITTVFCGNALGEFIPPYIIFKGKQVWSDWLYEAPPGTKMNVSPSGWIDHGVFDDWFKNHFLQYANKNEGKKILLCDNLSAHISLETLKLCQQHNIAFICLIPNSTHLLQPLDVSYFASLKSTWRKVLLEWRQTKDGKRCVALPKAVFSQLLKKTILQGESTASQNLSKGFSSTGIYPFNPQHVLNKLPAYAKESLEVSEQVGNEFCKYFEEIRSTDLKLVTKPKKYLLPVQPGKSVSTEEVADYYAKRGEAAALKSCGGPKTRGGIRKRGSGIRTRGGKLTSMPNAERSVATQICNSLQESQQNIEERDLEEFVELNDLGGNAPSEIVIEYEEGGLKQATTVQESISDSHFNVNDHVIVLYEEELFPGQVIEIDNSNEEQPMYKVQCMTKSGPYWKWPITPDVTYYYKQDVIKKIEEENIVPASNRGVFKVADPVLEAKWLSGHPL